MNDLPSAQIIAAACQSIQDYTPVAELAKAACDAHPYDLRWVAGISLTRWQTKIFEAQVFALLGDTP